MQVQNLGVVMMKAPKRLALTLQGVQLWIVTKLNMDVAMIIKLSLLDPTLKGVQIVPPKCLVAVPIKLLPRTDLMEKDAVLNHHLDAVEIILILLKDPIMRDAIVIIPLIDVAQMRSRLLQVNTLVSCLRFEI